jgi:formate dehydrogenase
VAEVTGSNVVSVAEHVVMMILSLVRNYMTGYNQVGELAQYRSDNNTSVTR